MSQGSTHHSSHTTHSTHSTSETGKELKHLAVDEHKVARGARKVDSTVYMGEVLASGNPKRIERYFLRKLAYKLFGKFMGKTINRI